MILNNNGIYLVVNNFLNNRDINRLGLTSQTYFILSNSNAIWKPIYDDLMKDKLIEFNTSFISRLLKCNINYKYKYYITLWDSKREFITLDELIEKVFSFRFKEAAGEDWVARDPCK